MRLRFFLALALAAGGASISFGQKIETRTVDIGGRKLWMEAAGKGGATVVLESGLGDDHSPWYDVFSQVAKFTRVVAYDRAGYGNSDRGPSTTTWAGIATDLHTMLHNANVPGPYVLVGHSLGGPITRTFAHLFPAEVSGLVWLDPMTEGMLKMIPPDALNQAIADQDAEMKGATLAAQTEWALARQEEVAGFPVLTSFGPPPDVPMMLLIAGTGRPPGWQDAVTTAYGPWIYGATEAGMVYVSESTHYMQTQATDTVVSAIRRVVFPSPLLITRRVIKEKGVAAGIAAYSDMWRRYPREYMHESYLNVLGYEQLNAKHVDDAVALLKLNAELFPHSFNVYDSLGEAYAAAGKKDLAIKNYRKSLELNPQNTDAVEMLKKLGG